MHSSAELPELEEALKKRHLLLETTRPLPSHKLGTIRRGLQEAADSAQGPDHWTLKHLAKLPEEGLRQLALILFVMARGAVPAQELLVYIGLMRKPAGGERPIGLTPMLYRLEMRLRKALISE